MPQGGNETTINTEKILLDQPFEERDLHSLRHAVAAHVDDTALPHDRANDLVLIVSELASNAIRHGGGRGHLRLWATDDAVYCRISDDGPGLPERPPADRPAPTASGGRGFWLVRTYADELTIDSDAENGTTVTITIRRPPAAS